jgi:hypothetical protein
MQSSTLSSASEYRIASIFKVIYYILASTSTSKYVSTLFDLLTACGIVIIIIIIIIIIIKHIPWPLVRNNFIRIWIWKLSIASSESMLKVANNDYIGTST